MHTHLHANNGPLPKQRVQSSSASNMVRRAPSEALVAYVQRLNAALHVTAQLLIGCEV